MDQRAGQQAFLKRRLNLAMDLTDRSSTGRPQTTQATAVSKLARTAIALAWLTVAWNLVEAGVALFAGQSAGSTALIGFGLDSLIEVSSALVVLWQLRSDMAEEREQQALKLIALSFFALAIWVTLTSVITLISQTQPEESKTGIVLAIVSLIVMPVLALAKRRVGKAMSSATVVADSAQTWLCTSLSAVLLVGLVANATLGWWWADPVAGLVIAAVAVREGREAWRGENCCGPVVGTGSSSCSTEDACSSS